MQITYRKATSLDLPRCFEIRGATRDNAFSEAQLHAIGVTPEGWVPFVDSGAYVGMVAAKGTELVGFCFGDTKTSEILVLAVLAGHEGEGIGKQLLQSVSDTLFDAGHSELWLAASATPVVRSYGFYRHVGWRPTATLDENGDEIYRLNKADKH